MFPKSNYEAAYGVIRRRILDGEFELGSRLSEVTLAKELSLSRTPVREAINRLIAEGLVVRQAQKGLYVINPDSAEIEDYIDIRVSLEQLAVRECISRATDSELSEVSAAISEFRNALKECDYDVCNALDSEFHSTIAGLSRNAKLISMLSDLADYFQLVRSAEKKTHPKEKNERTLREHKAIADAILQRDVAAASEAVSKNIETMRENLWSNVKETPLAQVTEGN